MLARWEPWDTTIRFRGICILSRQGYQSRRAPLSSVRLERVEYPDPSGQESVYLPPLSSGEEPKTDNGYPPQPHDIGPVLSYHVSDTLKHRHRLWLDDTRRTGTTTWSYTRNSWAPRSKGWTPNPSRHITVHIRPYPIPQCLDFLCHIQYCYHIKLRKIWLVP